MPGLRIPAFSFFSNLWYRGGMIHGIPTLAQLTAIVFEQDNRVTPKKEDGGKVAKRHQRHCDICKTPYKIQ